MGGGAWRRGGAGAVAARWERGGGVGRAGESEAAEQAAWESGSKDGDRLGADRWEGWSNGAGEVVQQGQKQGTGGPTKGHGERLEPMGGCFWAQKSPDRSRGVFWCQSR